MLEGDGERARPMTWSQPSGVRHWVGERYGKDVGLAIADSRYTHAHVLAREVTRQADTFRRTLSDRIDSLVLGRWTGIPLFTP